MRPAVLAVVGPTGAGKSELALQLAGRLGGEIVNADAMALFRGMDIGTAKPSPAQQAQVRHHLLDVWEISRAASVADYQALAVVAVAGVQQRGAVPVVVGGSGLYLRSLLDELVMPPTDPVVRADLEAELAALGAPALHERLTRLDPAAAAAILPGNGRRLVRALEVVALTGSFTASLPDGSYRWPGTVVLGVHPPDLPQRIEARVAAMFEAGLVHEVRQLEQRGLRNAPTASRALGYAQVLADPRTAPQLTVIATRQFARRQRSWLRRDTRIRWLPGRDLDTALAALGPPYA